MSEIKYDVVSSMNNVLAPELGISSQTIHCYKHANNSANSIVHDPLYLTVAEQLIFHEMTLLKLRSCFNQMRFENGISD